MMMGHSDFSQLPLPLLLFSVICLFAICVLLVSTLIIRHAPLPDHQKEAWFILTSIGVLILDLSVLATETVAGIMLTLGGGVAALIGLVSPWLKRVYAKRMGTTNESP